MHSTIKRVVSVVKKGEVWVTQVEDADGNTPTGVGNDFQVGDAIVVYFDDRFNKTKFHRIKSLHNAKFGVH